MVNGTPNITWTTITSTGMLLLIIVGAFWGLAFGPVQDKFGDVNRRMVVLETNDIHFRDVLDSRRHEFVSVETNHQFEQRLVDRLTMLESQIKQLELTRPTTGELQVTTRSFEERLRSLENKKQ